MVNSSSSDEDLARSAVVGIHRHSCGTAGTRVKITYADLEQSADLLCRTLYDQLASNSYNSHCPITIGVAIPSSSPLFALSCQALHMTHDRTRFTTPLVLVPLDTDDPAVRSKHLLQCLQLPLQQEIHNVGESRGVAVILTSGVAAVAHWRQLVVEASQEEGQSKDSLCCVVIDMEELIRHSAELSGQQKWQWLWEEEFVGESSDGGKVNTTGDLVELNMWDEEEEEMEESTTAVGCVLEQTDFLARSKGGDISCFIVSPLSPVVVSTSVTKVSAAEEASTYVSHIAFTSGTSTGSPKGCACSHISLVHYCSSKNTAHGITCFSTVLLVSAATFDPALSDVIATFRARGTLVVASRLDLQSRVGDLVQMFGVTHMLGTPAWFTHTDLMTDSSLSPGCLPTLKVIALGGEAIPPRVVRKWARPAMPPQPPVSVASVVAEVPVSVVAEAIVASTNERKDGNYDESCSKNSASVSHVRLLATYGTTEACVYQTVGELFQSNKNHRSEGAYVGQALLNLNIRICTETPVTESSSSTQSQSGGAAVNMQLIEVQGSDSDSGEQSIGEIVIEGSQIDHLSGYYNHDSSSASSVFVHNTWADGTSSFCYRTGDRGFLCPPFTFTSSLSSSSMPCQGLYLVGRIADAPRMIKINGIRVDPLEIEEAVMREFSSETARTVLEKDITSPIVYDCVVVISSEVCSFPLHTDATRSQIVAYCVFSEEVVRDLGVEPRLLVSGLICPPGPLLTLLRMRCTCTLKRGIVPAVFVLIKKVPVTATGKRNLKMLPTLSQCSGMQSSNSSNSNNSNSGNYNSLGSNISSSGALLVACGGAGPAVAAEIISCLNLQPCQHSSVTTKVSSQPTSCHHLSSASLFTYTK
jgi:acyl-CoA synthetase (AMP-forming)/AMP-acid ligase II